MKESSKKSLKAKYRKVPQMLQLEATECGAVCLSMILAFYGKWVPSEQMRKSCGVSRDGSKASNILKAARSYGLVASGYRASAELLLKEQNFPCIVMIRNSHYVVVTKCRSGKVYINDPADGSVVLSKEEFQSLYSGITLEFTPTEDFEPGGQKPSLLGFAQKRIQGTVKLQLIITAAVLMGSFLSVTALLFTQFFYDYLLEGGVDDLFIPFLGAVLFVGVLRIALNWIKSLQLIRLNAICAVADASSFMWRLLRLPMNFYSQKMTGSLMARQQINETLSQSFLELFSGTVVNVVMLVLYLIAMLFYSVPLAFIGIGATLLNLVAVKLVSAQKVNISRVLTRDECTLSAQSVAGINMIETIKASSAENGYFEKWASTQGRVSRLSIELLNATETFQIFPNLIVSIANAVVISVGVVLVLQGEFTIGMLMAFQGFFSSFMSPAVTLGSNLDVFSSLRDDMERVEDVSQCPIDSTFSDEPEMAENFRKLSGAFSVRHVSFGYSELEKPLLEDFSLEVKQGESIALVGASGSGKSTISKLLTGLYQPWSGEIFFDGKPIREINKSIFCSSLAAVDQDITLFEDSIADNIRMWDKAIEDFEVVLAARDACLHEDIAKRKGGYQAQLSENGDNLSGGQRQRMEIARVLAQDPTIVILDEATSALDAKTEKSVMEAIRRRGVTTVIIAHRLSTVRDCDRIIVIDRGRIAEEGSHDELIAAQGMYSALVSKY